MDGSIGKKKRGESQNCLAGPTKVVILSDYGVIAGEFIVKQVMHCNGYMSVVVIQVID